MPSNLAIDDDLLDEALRIGGQNSKRATVNLALQEFIMRRKRLAAIDSFGTFEWDEDYDYKEARRKR